MNARRTGPGSAVIAIVVHAALGAPTAWAGADTTAYPGRWELSPAPSSGSHLCMKRALLEATLCSESSIHDLGGAAEVRLHVNNDAGRALPAALPAVLRSEGEPDRDGFTLVLEGVAGRTDELTCGSWMWRLVREPVTSEAPYPVTQRDGGVVSTALDLPAEIEFENAEGAVYRLPYQVSVAFNSLSALVPLPLARPLLAEGYSNLLLMAAFSNGCYQAAPACWTSDTCGLLCLGASPHSLGLANSGGTCGATGH
jgi:hypothetical protein